MLWRTAHGGFYFWTSKACLLQLDISTDGTTINCSIPQLLHSNWEDIKKGLGVAPEDSDLKKSQDRLQKLLMLVNAWLHICSILQSSSSSSSSSVLVLAHWIPSSWVWVVPSHHAIFSQSPTEDKAKRRSEESLLQDVWMKAGSWPHRVNPGADHCRSHAAFSCRG